MLKEQWTAIPNIIIIIVVNMEHISYEKQKYIICCYNQVPVKTSVPAGSPMLNSNEPVQFLDG